MNRVLAAFCAFLALTWCAPAAAAIGTPAPIGTANTGATNGTTWSIPTTQDAPAGAAIIGVINAPSGATTMTVTDTAGNSYAVTTKFTASTAGSLWLFHMDNPLDLPGPTTATGSITTTVVTFTTNPGTLVVGQVVTGAGVTANTLIASGISQWNGSSASATVNNSQSVVSETLTVSSAITATWNASGHVGMGAVSVSGLATASAIDVTGAGNNTGTPGTSASISTGTLAQASEIVFGQVATAGTTAVTPAAAGFTAFSTITIASGNNVINWGYQIVSSTASVTYAPSWGGGTTRAFGVNVYSFKALGAATACRLALLGVGSC